jgi:hypothetical protein
VSSSAELAPQARSVDTVRVRTSVDTVRRSREEEIRHKLVVRQGDRARAVAKLYIGQERQPVPGAARSPHNDECGIKAG